MKSKDILSEDDRRRIIDIIIQFGDGEVEFHTLDIQNIINALQIAEEEIEKKDKLLESKDKEIAEVKERLLIINQSSFKIESLANQIQDDCNDENMIYLSEIQSLKEEIERLTKGLNDKGFGIDEL